VGATGPRHYSAFGNKQQLFLEAMHRFAGDRSALQKETTDAPTARDAVAGMLRKAALHFTEETTPPGYLLESATAT